MTRDSLQRLKDQLVKDVALYVQPSKGFESWELLDYWEAAIKLRTYGVIAQELAEERRLDDVAQARAKVSAVCCLLRKIRDYVPAGKTIATEALDVLESISWEGGGS